MNAADSMICTLDVVFVTPFASITHSFDVLEVGGLTSSKSSSSLTSCAPPVGGQCVLTWFINGSA